MKAFFRSSFFQSVLGGVIWAYMVLIAKTTRWTIEGLEDMRAAWPGEKGLIVATWHSRVLLLPTAWSNFLRKWDCPGGPAAILISLSPDGEFVAKASNLLGLRIIRGSSINKRKSDKKKGGIAAVVEAGQLLENQGVLCVTLDGPRGPRQRANIGAIKIAQRKGAPIMIYALANSGARRLKSWDRMMLPSLFGRGAIIFDGPIAMPKDVDPEVLRLEVEQRLNRATERAEQMVGLSSLEPAPAKTPIPQEAAAE